MRADCSQDSTGEGPARGAALQMALAGAAVLHKTRAAYSASCQYHGHLAGGQNGQTASQKTALSNLTSKPKTDEN